MADMLDDPESLLSGTPIKITDVPNGELACQLRARRRTFRPQLPSARKLSNLTSNVSLDAIEIEVLRDIDLMAHRDPTYRTFVRDMTRALGQAGNLVKTLAINGFYEVYAEAMVLRFLRGRGINTSRVRDTTSAPDFECQTECLTWFVEVKSFDIVGGAIRNRQIMESGLEP